MSSVLRDETGAADVDCLECGIFFSAVPHLMYVRREVYDALDRLHGLTPSFGPGRQRQIGRRYAG